MAAIAADTAQAMGQATQAVADLARQAHVLQQLILDMPRQAECRVLEEDIGLFKYNTKE